MKRASCIVAIVALLGSLTACGMRVDAAGRVPASGEIILVTDRDEDSDSSVLRAVWSGISAYGEETGRDYIRIEAQEPTTESRLGAIEGGLSAETLVVVCIGSAYESVVFEAQLAHPDVMFLLLDGEPHSGEGQIYETSANTHCILYQETQAGFLAGYAAVMEGYRKLGFCGGSGSPAVVRYGYGFLQGADAAAVRLGLASGLVEIQLWYAGQGQSQAEIRSKMVSWYGGGTQLVFACDSGKTRVTPSVISAAVAKEGKVIGAGTDRSIESLTVVCSVVKDYEASVEAALVTLDENGGLWGPERAGYTLSLGAGTDGVHLADSTSAWRLHHVSSTDCDEIMQQLQNGSILLDQGSSRELLPAMSLCNITDHGEG